MAGNAAVTAVPMGGRAAWFGGIRQDEHGEGILPGLAAEGATVASVRRAPDVASPVGGPRR
jgi:sugar/nucleoside kinase (ribokinase family)